MKTNSLRDFWLAPRGDKQRSCGPRAAGVRVSIPGFGIAMVETHQVQLPIMSRQLEEQGCPHFPCRNLVVLIPAAMHPPPGP